MRLLTGTLFVSLFTPFVLAQPADDSSAKCSAMLQEPEPIEGTQDLVFGGERGELISGQTTFDEAVTLRIIVP